jgi:hypothetical protein
MSPCNFNRIMTLSVQYRWEVRDTPVGPRDLCKLLIITSALKMLKLSGVGGDGSNVEGGNIY